MTSKYDILHLIYIILTPLLQSRAPAVAIVCWNGKNNIFCVNFLKSHNFMLLWHSAKQAEGEEVHSSSRDLLTNKLDTNDFEASIEQFCLIIYTSIIEVVHSN